MGMKLLDTCHFVGAFTKTLDQKLSRTMKHVMKFKNAKSTLKINYGIQDSR